MFRTSLVFILATAALAQTNSQTNGHEISNGLTEAQRKLGNQHLAQSNGYEISNGTGTLKSGAVIRYRSVATPDGTFVRLIAEGISMSESGLHRFVIDKTTASYFGYDLVIGPGDSTNSYQATFQPLTGVDALVAHLSGNPSLRAIQLPNYPAPRIVREGDVISLVLMVSADGKHKLTDYIEVLPAPGSTAPDENADASDFTVDDGPLKFEGTRPGLWVNGQARELTAFSGKPGATFWIAFPGQGRYIVSLAPQDGFTKGGTIHGDTISFEDGGQRFDIRFGGPIAGGKNVWNLYVLHDMSYESALPVVVSAGTDRLENLWTKR